MNITTRAYLELIDSHPGVVREALKHRDKEHEAAGPVDDEEHHADEVEYFHEHSNGLQKLSNTLL